MPLAPKQLAFVREYCVNVDRFWSYVRRGGDGECWEWLKAKGPRGYGHFHIGKSANSTMTAHRVAFGIATGEAPEAVCHRCDNPGCCNPSHLFGGTRAINNADMVAKGRHWSKVCPEKAAKGVRVSTAKLTDDAVRQVKEIYKRGGITQRALAAQFGVSQRTVNKVVNGIGWVHVQ